MTRNTIEKTFLAGDIGGTKTNIGLFVPGKKRPRLKKIHTYASREAGGLEAILQDFVQNHASSPASAAFGIAGPVINGRSKTTNLPWVVSEEKIGRHFGWKNVRLLNDLAATALSVPFLIPVQTCRLNGARGRRGGNIGVVAPGTGLGAALLVSQGQKYIPISTESGHVDFAPQTGEEVSLWRHLHRKFGHVSVERVLSGQGLVNIYQWLKNLGRYQEPGWLKERMKTMDPAQAIAETALEKDLPLCRHTLEYFVSILGAVCGNVALTAMATGGIYLGGGIPAKILPALKDGRFLKAFRNKGRFEGFLEKIPVKVILDSKAALLGAAISAEEMVS